MKRLSLIWAVAKREAKILYINRLYACCMVVFPLLTMFFFTSLMDEGLPEDMPVGVVDLDNTSTSRSLVRRLDAFQNSRVVARYPSQWLRLAVPSRKTRSMPSSTFPRVLPISSFPAVSPRCRIIIA